MKFINEMYLLLNSREKALLYNGEYCNQSSYIHNIKEYVPFTGAGNSLTIRSFERKMKSTEPRVAFFLTKASKELTEKLKLNENREFFGLSENKLRIVTV